MLACLQLEHLEKNTATRAGLSQSHMSRIFITWVHFLHSRCYVAFHFGHPEKQLIIQCQLRCILRHKLLLIAQKYLLKYQIFSEVIVQHTPLTKATTLPRV